MNSVLSKQFELETISMLPLYNYDKAYIRWLEDKLIESDSLNQKIKDMKVEIKVNFQEFYFERNGK